MIGRLAVAVVVGAVVGLGVLLLGLIFAELEIPVLVTVGGFLTQWAWVIGILAGLYSAFTGWRPAL